MVIRLPVGPQKLLFGALIILPVACGGLAGAQAQPAPSGPLVLDPDSAAVLALRNSPQLRVDAQSVAQAEAQLQQVFAIGNWQIGLTGTLLRRGPEPALPADFSSFFVKTLHNEVISASKILWTWGKLEAQRDFARQGIEAARTQAAVTRLALAKLARQALLKLVTDQRLLDVDYETQASLMEHQRVTEKRYREGLIAFFEVAQAEAQVASTQAAIARRLSAIDRDRVALRRVLNVEQTTSLEASVSNMPQPPDMDLQKSIEYALEARPETAQARAGVRLQEAATRVAQQSLQPTVGVSAQVSEQTVSFTSTPISYQITVSFQKALSDGGTRKAQVKGAQAQLEAARQRLELVAQVIAAEVADSYVQIEQLRAQVASAEVQERAAREQLRIARLRFEEDVGLGFEVITAQAAVSQAQAARATAELDLRTAIVGLRAAMGMLDLQEAPQS